MDAVMEHQLSVGKMLKRAMDCYQQGYLLADVSVPGWHIVPVNQAFSASTGVPGAALLMTISHAIHVHACTSARHT